MRLQKKSIIHDKSAKGFDSDQPAQSAQAGLSRNLLLLVRFLLFEGPYHHMIHLDVKTESRMSKAITNVMQIN